MSDMRQTTAASVVALGILVAPANAQQTIYNDQNFQPQGQVFQPLQQPFGNQPVYIDPNTGQPLPNQPGFGQPLPQPQQGFGQQQPQFQPQPNFGQPLPQPQPSYGQQLPQPQPSYGQQLPQPQQPFGQQPTQPIGSTVPQNNVPYYERAGDTTVPQPVRPAEPVDPTVDPAIQVERPTAGPAEAQPPAFDNAQPTATGDRAPDMSAELSELIRVGERYRAASPGFFEDLKGLAEKYREPLPQAALPAVTDPIGIDPDDDDGDGDVDLASTDTGAPTDPDAFDPLGPDPLTDPTGTNAVFPTDPNAVTTIERLDQGSIATIVFLEDYFDDGEIEYNPPWRVRQGNWGIDPVYGLRAKAPEQVSDEPIKPKELLKTLLSGDTTPDDDRASKPQAALIESQVSIGNAFSLAARIVDHEGKGAAHFIMHQGGSDWLGYRLELRSGPQPVVVLTRRGSNGYKDITKVAAPSFTKGKTHELRWARLSDGQMLVILNGRPIITSRDTVFREDWKGFAFFNAGGDVSIRGVRIAAPVER